MATLIGRIDIWAPASNSVPARREYPWHIWGEVGKVWEIVSGVDYDVPSMSMRAVLSTRAKRTGVKVTATVDTTGKRMKFVFYDASMQRPSLPDFTQGGHTE